LSKHHLFPWLLVEINFWYSVIAVHGIGVDPTATWTHPKTNKNWLRDGTMLPQELPSARIMAFAYNSVWYGDDAVKQSLEGVANSLLLQLGEQRAVRVTLMIVVWF